MRKVKRGEIYWCDLGRGVGSEQGNLRPFLIIQNDIGNKFSPTTIGVPLTGSSTKAKLPVHVDMNNDDVALNEVCCTSLYENSYSIALCEQIRVVDKRRLKEFIGLYPDMNSIDKALLISVGITI